MRNFTQRGCCLNGQNKNRFKSSIKLFAIKLSGNHAMQRLLNTLVSYMHLLMGIGSGGGVFSSGEKCLMQIILQNFSPPYLIFDIGANLGDFIQLVKDSINPGDWKIHAFEPSKAAYQVLYEKYKDDNHVVLNNVAIGKDIGKATLYYDLPGSPIASLTKRKLEHFNIDFNYSEEVNITTIENYCKDAGIEGNIHLLKLDIEGHELDALDGVGNMLRDNKISMVSFEFGGCNIDTRTYFRDFWEFFVRNKMRIFRITPSGYLHPIVKYKEIYEQFRTTNFIATNDFIKF
jgi:FkbM family methyltransferase